MAKSASIVVLLVEDEALIRLSTAGMLEDAGFTVVAAENADAAVRVLEMRADIRIVFTDVDMPGSMDGLKLAAAVRARWPPVEIVVTSGFRSVKAGEMPPRSKFISKPYSNEIVLSTLRQCIS